MTDIVRGSCFVIMGFGKKTDFETGRTLDLDITYRSIIKPAVEAAGLRCVRADEIAHSGVIDKPMFDQLLTADVVIADLSTSNRNVFYELGIRHALRPATTIVIAEDGLRYPFDVNTVLVRQYRHLGEGIDFNEVERFRSVLTSALVELLGRETRAVDSPVYIFLPGLNPPTMSAPGADGKDAAEKEARAATTLVTVGDASSEPSLTHSSLMEQADEAQRNGDFLAARTILGFVHRRMKSELPGRPEDPYVIQRLALVTYKSKFPTPEEALREARDLLITIEPETSNDTETLGLWAAVNKRLWDLTTTRAHLDEAVRGYERAFYLRNDYYNGISLAYLLNVRAASGSGPAEAIADFVQARRVRGEVVALCRKWLDARPGLEDRGQATKQERYWVMATLAEAYIGLEDEAGAQQVLDEAASLALESWMTYSTDAQLQKLRALLADSPLKYIGKDAAQG